MIIIKVLSLFDGMSCGRIALERAGIDVSNYYASEVDKYAIKVAQENYPNTIQLGDVKEWKEWELSELDLIIGGSPCQGFSFAGKGLNFDDPRSRLFFDYVEAVNHYKPKYFLLENVRMKQEYQDVISSYLGIEPITINSSLVSAQNRVRLYWTNIPNVGQPENKKICWGDIRERGVAAENFYYSDRALNWIYRHGRSRGKVMKVHQDDENMQMLEASHFKKYSSQRFFGILDDGIDNTIQREVLNNFKSPENKELPFEQYEKVLNGNMGYRYITPLECERLQNVPDNYTDSVSNTQRYKMLGNGWTVDVIAHIFKGLLNEN